MAAAGYREGWLRVGTVQTLCLLGLLVGGYLVALYRLALAGSARNARCDGVTLEVGRVSVPVQQVSEVRVGSDWSTVVGLGGRTLFIPSTCEAMRKLALSIGAERLREPPAKTRATDEDDQAAGSRWRLRPGLVLAVLAMGAVLGTHLEFLARWAPLPAFPFGPAPDESPGEAAPRAVATLADRNTDRTRLVTVGSLRMRLGPAEVAGIEACDDRTGHRVRFADGSRLVLCPAGSPPLRPDAALEELAGALLAGPRHAGLDEAGLARLRDLHPWQVFSLAAPSRVLQLDRLLDLRQEVVRSLAGHGRFSTPFGSGFWLDLNERSRCGKWHDVIHLQLEGTAWVLFFSGARPTVPFPRARLEKILASCRLAAD